MKGTRVDTGYGGHAGGYDETLECFKFDTQAEADKFSELSDRALDLQGGKSRLFVVE